MSEEDIDQDHKFKTKKSTKIQLKLDVDEESSLVLQNYSRFDKEPEKKEKVYHFREVVRDKNKR